MRSPSSHVLCVFSPVKRSCRSGGQKGKAHANGQCWPHWVSEQRWPPACITPGAQHAGPRLQYITSTGGIWQAHSRCAFSFTSRCIKYNNPSIRPTWREAWSQKEDAMRTRMPRSTEALDMHARSLAPLSIARRQSIPAKSTWFTP